MNTHELRNDPIAGLLERETPSAQFLQDDEGYYRVLFAPEELTRFQIALGIQLDEAIDGAQDRWDEARENERTYNGIDAKDAGVARKDRKTLVLPLAKRHSNQVTAYVVQNLLGRRPYTQADPQDQGEIPVLGPPAGPGAPPSQAMVSVEDLAEEYELLFDDILERGNRYRQLVTDWTADFVRGIDAPMIKLVYDPTRGKQLSRVINEDGRPTNEFDEKVDKQAIPYKLMLVRTFNWVMSPGALDHNDAELFAERMPGITATQIRERVWGGQYDFGRPPEKLPTEDEIRQIIAGAESDEDDWAQAMESEGKKTQSHDRTEVWECWPEWPILTGFAEDGEPEIEVFRLQVHYHRASHKVLMVRKHPYTFARLPYVPGFYRRLPDEFRSDSIVGDLAPVQDLASSLYRLQTQNSAQATLKAYMVRKGSIAQGSLLKAINKNGGIRPGDVLEFGQKDEIEPFQVGAGSSSLQQEIAMAMSEAEKLATTSEIDYGDVPGRTADAAIKRVQEQSKMQTTMAIESAREQLAEVFAMLASMVQQYNPTGRMISVKDPKKQQMVKKAISMPTEPVESKFRFVVRASTEDQSREAERERLMIDKQLIDQSNQFLMQGVATMLDPSIPPLFEQFIMEIGVRDQEGLRRILALHRKDADAVTWSRDEFMGMLQLKHQAMMEAQQEQVAQGEEPGMNPEGDPNAAAAAQGQAGGPVQPAGPGAAPPQ